MKDIKIEPVRNQKEVEPVKSPEFKTYYLVVQRWSDGMHSWAPCWNTNELTEDLETATKVFNSSTWAGMERKIISFELPF